MQEVLCRLHHVARPVMGSAVSTASRTRLCPSAAAVRFATTSTTTTTTMVSSNGSSGNIEICAGQHRLDHWTSHPWFQRPMRWRGYLEGMAWHGTPVATRFGAQHRGLRASAVVSAAPKPKGHEDEEPIRPPDDGEEVRASLREGRCAQ